MESKTSLDELEQLYRTNLRAFVRVAGAIIGDNSVAADAVHDALVKCVRGLDAYRGDGTLEAWVWSAVVNSARRVRRARGGQTELDQSELLHAANQHDDYGDVVRRAVAALPERQRVAIFLRYYADLDYRAIAQVMEIEVGTVGATIAQAQSSLHATLTKEAVE